MLNLWHVTAFVTVADCGHFHEAARRLGLAQPTISQHIKRLEAALGAALIVRGQGECVVTPRGALFLPYARSLLAVATRARDVMADRRTVIGASSNIGIYILPPHLRRIHDRRDQVGDVDLVIGTNPDIAAKLEAREIDLAVMEWWDGRPGFQAQAWRRERLVLIVAPDHPWAQRHDVSIDEVLATPLLAGEPGTGTATLLRTQLGDKANALRVSRTLGSTEAVKQAVKAGLGISLVLERSVHDEVQCGSVRAIGISGPALAKELLVIRSQHLPESSRAATVAALLVGQQDAGAAA